MTLLQLAAVADGCRHHAHNTMLHATLAGMAASHEKENR
jgi:hypothetical protein